MSIPGRSVVVLPGKRPPPPVPPDVEEIVRVLNGAAPKVCPACGRPWSAEAPCVCLEPEPVVSPWVRLWRWWRAWRAPPEPRIVYDAELSRPTPPAVTSGRMRHTLAADQSTPGRIVVTVKDP